MNFESLLIKALFCIILVVSLYCEYTLCKQNSKNCIVNDSQGCTCNFTDGSGVVDIRRLGNRNNTPRFKDIRGTEGTTYSYNPCYGFSEGDCKSAAVCMLKNGSQTVVGEAGTAKYEYVENYGVVAVYTVLQYGAVSMFRLTCDPNATEPTLKAFGGGSEGFYLISMCACPGLCTDAGHSNLKR